MSDNYIKPVPDEKSGSGRGCLIGCLIAAVVVMVLAALGVFGVYYTGKQMLNAVTDTEPMELKETTLSQEEMTAATERLEAFLTGVKEQPELSHNLELTGEEINALIQTSPDWQEISKYVHLEIVGDTIGGEVSIPLGELIDIGFLQGRYINGKATFSVDITNGRPVVFIDSLSSREGALPEAVLEGIRQENLLKDLQIDPEMQEVLDSVEEFRIEDGKLKVTVKGQAAELAA